MDFFRRTIPSLDALVFFEAAARHRNFTRAAEELRVSQVAVSKRVRALEDDLGAELFARQGRALVLTPAGRALADRVRAGMGFLEEAILTARSGARRARQIVQVAANENMNFFWLAPLVRDFQMAGNEAIVSVVTANNVTDVVQEETDLAIFYGRSAPDGWIAEPLFGEIIAPVASPTYLARIDRGEKPIRLDYRKEAPEWVNWETLKGSEGEDWFPQAERRVCSSYIQSISLAVEGSGIGLGVVPMLAREMADGRLVQLASPVWTGNGYFLGTPAGRPRSPATTELIATMMLAATAWRAEDELVLLEPRSRE